jgi:hypothetical protein
MMTIALRCFVLLIALMPLVLVRTANAQPPSEIRRELVIEASLVSYLHDKGLEGYNHHGGGTTTARGTLGLGLRINGVSAMVNIKSEVKSGRVTATVDLEPDEAKRSLEFQQQKVDLSELKPSAIRLTKDESGRVFQLNLAPTVRVTDHTPKRLEVEKLQLHHWRFPDSPVLVNDALYVGRLAMAQSPVAHVDISGVARVEFSLYELTDAKPWGVLNDRMVTLTNPQDKTTIQISNVLNGGPQAIQLAGGPYRVWVRWSAPTRSVEEHRRELIEMRKRLVSDDLPDSALTYLDKQLARPAGPWLYTSGGRGLQKDEQVKGRQ